MKHSFADLTRARAVLRYEPVVNFKEGLVRTMEWYSRVPKPTDATLVAAQV